MIQSVMHQSDLYLPPVHSRFAPSARLPTPGSSSDWPESFSTGSSAAPKKRKVERACDGCRRRKTRCDGPKMPDNVCTNCVQNRKICTYVLARTFVEYGSALIALFSAKPPSLGVPPKRSLYLAVVNFHHPAHMPLTVISLVWRTEWRKWRHC